MADRPPGKGQGRTGRARGVCQGDADYTEVLEVHEALQKANESINKSGLVPVSL